MPETQTVINNTQAIFHRIFMNMKQWSRLGYAAVSIQQIYRQSIKCSPAVTAWVQAIKKSVTGIYCRFTLADKIIAFSGELNVTCTEPVPHREYFSGIIKVLQIAQIWIANLCGIVKIAESGKKYSVIDCPDLI